MKRIIQHFSFIMLFLILTLVIHYFLGDARGAEWFFGPLRFKLVFNSGFIFGLFSEVSRFIRIVCSVVFLGFITIIWCYFYSFLSKEVQLLKWGMTFVLAGITGNSMEKLIYGYVSDFISLNVGSLSQFYFNLSDVIQIVGLVIIVVEIFRHQKIIWFPDPKRRKKLFLYPDVQLPMVLKLMGLILIGSLTQGILAIALLFPQLKRGSQDVQVLFILCIFILNVALLPMIGAFFLKELLRCLGPIYALDRHLKGDEAGKKPLIFRKTDHFKSLEQSFNDFISRHFKP